MDFDLREKTSSLVERNSSFYLSFSSIWHWSSTLCNADIIEFLSLFVVSIRTLNDQCPTDANIRFLLIIRLISSPKGQFRLSDRNCSSSENVLTLRFLSFSFSMKTFVHCAENQINVNKSHLPIYICIEQNEKEKEEEEDRYRSLMEWFRSDGNSCRDGDIFSSSSSIGCHLSFLFDEDPLFLVDNVCCVQWRIDDELFLCLTQKGWIWISMRCWRESICQRHFQFISWEEDLLLFLLVEMKFSYLDEIEHRFPSTVKGFWRDQ